METERAGTRDVEPTERPGVLPSRTSELQSPIPRVTERVAHEVRVVHLPDGYGAMDYYAVCSCGRWASGSRVRESAAAILRCEIEAAESQGRYNIGRYFSALAKAVCHGG